MNTYKKLLAISLITLSIGFSSSSFALSFADAKNGRMVRETSSGYLAAVTPSAAVNALINDINAKRKAHYTRISSQNGIALSAVEASAGKKAIKNMANW